MPADLLAGQVLFVGICLIRGYHEQDCRGSCGWYAQPTSRPMHFLGPWASASYALARAVDLACCAVWTLSCAWPCWAVDLVYYARASSLV
eukprot:351458-Rhodomonas_salina.1